MIHIFKTTIEELIQILRDKYNISDDEEIKLIIEQSLPENKPKPVESKEWITVPINWKTAHCPVEEYRDQVIEVILRSGVIVKALASEWDISWVQTNDDRSIVKYRLAN